MGGPQLGQAVRPPGEVSAEPGDEHHSEDEHAEQRRDHEEQLLELLADEEKRLPGRPEGRSGQPAHLLPLIGGNDPRHLRMVLFENIQTNFRILDQDTMTNQLGHFSGYRFFIDIPFEFDEIYQSIFAKIGAGNWPFNIFAESFSGQSSPMSDLDIDVFKGHYDKNGDGRVDPEEIVYVIEWSTLFKLNYVPLKVAVENCSLFSGITVGFDEPTGQSEGWAYVIRRVSQLNPARTVAHEMGHLLGLPHCKSDAGCSGTGTNLMDWDKDLNQGVRGDFLSFGQWNRLH